MKLSRRVPDGIRGKVREEAITNEPQRPELSDEAAFEGLMTEKEVLAALRISRTRLWRRLRDPAENFPSPIKLSRRWWRRSAIARYVQQKETTALPQAKDG